ncbi:outer membrane lipoprotein carrier protein LolA [Pseudomonas sp. 5P_3.1_Bac2]|uniref:outer membrane lipoprotein carrier protein LolA n=1 Tax=Pseudomonas sp. 5P_3.1_Bac2 TaxID=2971617 RepID=UPI0021C76A99|nr:outer membrane lipoprotein carrier protein LolA [Pseudomonas sp. 5P_3.1_Bac2]MCU1718380.1 outer membrane lipoprotein carrier protein LolA [Pseudomonas sp. 5P_3.1_Bac2]
MGTPRQTRGQCILPLSLLLSALLFCAQAQAFDLDQLSAQLSQPTVIRGPLIQEKHLRALPKPLSSRGQFVLSAEHGLLWQLRSPLAQDYRIDRNGIFKRVANGWQQQPGQDIAAQQSRLFLAVLKGDHTGLAQDFDLKLSGNASQWQLQLTPKSLLLKQIFNGIGISGGALVEQIELDETQGDRTVLRLPANQIGDSLSAQEQSDFAQ